MKEENIYILSNEVKGDYTLIYAPESWDDTGIIIGRDTQFHGVNTEVSVDVRFVKDGKAYIDAVYDQQGIDAKINFFWHKLNKRTNDYELFYNGRIKLETRIKEDIYTSCAIEQDNFYSKIKNRLETPINTRNYTSLSGNTIPQFRAENENVIVSLHSKSILKQFISATSDKYVDSVDEGEGEVVPVRLNPLNIDKQVNRVRYISIGYINSTTEEISGMTISGTTGISISEPPPILTVEEPGPYKFAFNFDYDVYVLGSEPYIGAGNPLKLKNCGQAKDGGGVYDSATIRLYFKVVNAGVTKYENNIRISNSTGCGLYTLRIAEAFNYSIAQTLLADDKVYLYFKIETQSLYLRPLTGGSSAVAYYYKASINKSNSISITASTTSSIGSTTGVGIFIHEAWARAMQAVTDQSDPFRSSIYGRTTSQPYSYAHDGEFSLRVIMNGFAIRGFSEIAKPIFLTIKDLYDTCDAIDNVGLGIENGKAVVEKKEYFYKKEVLLFLRNVAEVKTSVAKEYYYNEYQFGYEKWENEETNNLDEFNSNRVYTLPIQSVNNKLIKRSPYIGSGYTIEFTRRQRYNASATKDWKYDNDNFIVVVKEATEEAFLHPWQAEKAEYFDGDRFENLLDPPTSYNLRIAPRRSIDRWGFVLNGSLKYYQNDKIKFAFGGANYKMKDKLLTEAVQVSENEDININTFDEAIWIPEYYEFEYPLYAHELEVIRSNPYGIIKFSTNELNYYGYIVSIKVDPYKNLADFKLLRANFTD